MGNFGPSHGSGALKGVVTICHARRVEMDLLFCFNAVYFKKGEIGGN